MQPKNNNEKIDLSSGQERGMMMMMMITKMLVMMTTDLSSGQGRGSGATQLLDQLIQVGLELGPPKNQ